MAVYGFKTKGAATELSSVSNVLICGDVLGPTFNQQYDRVKAFVRAASCLGTELRHGKMTIEKGTTCGHFAKKLRRYAMRRSTDTFVLANSE